LIDLHTHTTASDGRCAPAELVTRAAAARVDVLSVTDHDTVAASGAAAAACGDAGIEFVAGIEITAVSRETDVHVLGYFVDVASAALHRFLVEQRRQRIDRIREIVARLDRFGLHLDADAIVQPAIDDPSRSAGRPWIARALIAAGHVATSNEAFDQWLSRGRPAFVPRLAATPEDVIARIHDAGGLASLAHPGLLGRDEWIPLFVNASTRWRPTTPSTTRSRQRATQGWRVDMACRCQAALTITPIHRTARSAPGVCRCRATRMSGSSG
jgi:predicted metal-dependent phosphoesterase TrpH